MKSLLLGMIFSAAFGPVILAEAAPGNAWVSEFAFGLMGGTGGVLLCLSMYESYDLKRMAQEAMGNLLTAGYCGPGAAYWVGKIIGIEQCPQLIIPVSFVLGFCGASLVRFAKPVWTNAWIKWNERKASEFTGDNNQH